jgi:hypothetical protein
LHHALQMKEPPTATACVSPLPSTQIVHSDSPTLTIDQLVDGIRSNERTAAGEQPATRTYLPRPDAPGRRRRRPRLRIPALRIPSRRTMGFASCVLILVGAIETASTYRGNGREAKVSAINAPALSSSIASIGSSTTISEPVQLRPVGSGAGSVAATKPKATNNRREASPAAPATQQPASSPTSTSAPRPSSPSPQASAPDRAPAPAAPTPTPAPSPTTTPVAEPTTPSYDGCDPVNETC